MTVLGVDGAAGYGKTHRLLEALVDSIRAAPLAPGQRVLALTFMHGARRRLEERLRAIPGVRGRFECVTIDSFAWRLRHRWRSLLHSRALPEPAQDDFDAQCDLAGVLLERADVRSWVTQSFPIVLVDEAQDLKPQRLRMIAAMSVSANLLVAADEFQCLDGELRPNPAAIWLPTVCCVETLDRPRRTNVTGLLAAASALRAGRQPAPGKNFRILVAAGEPFAAACLAAAIAWSRGGSVATITPSLQGSYIRNVVSRVCAGPCGKAANGPYPIRWEQAEQEQASALLSALEMPDACSLHEAVQALSALPRSWPVGQTAAWLRRQERALGRTVISRAEVEARLRSEITARRHRQANDGHRLLAMTVHQAKNREFEGVVVIWPYQVAGDAAAKRRLLYNAITRARRWCTVLVQNAVILKSAPFA